MSTASSTLWVAYGAEGNVVGTVRKIELKDWVPTLTLQIEPGIKLPANATAKIGQSSILGTQHVELSLVQLGADVGGDDAGAGEDRAFPFQITYHIPSLPNVPS